MRDINKLCAFILLSTGLYDKLEFLLRSFSKKYATKEDIDVRTKKGGRLNLRSYKSAWIKLNFELNDVKCIERFVSD